jgi:Glycosyl transferase family 2
VTRPRIPEAVLSAAHERARARAAHDWDTADRLRGEIEDAGWTIVDRGTDFALSPAAPSDIEDGGRTRYGASRNVPSRLEEPPAGVATIVLIATDWPADLQRAIDGLRRNGPDGISLVVVADGASEEQAAALDSLEAPVDGVDVVMTSGRLGLAAALNVGIRRASGPVVLLLDTSVEPTGDIVTPLVRALEDEAVGVTGGWGLTSSDLRTFEEAPTGDVDAIEGYCLAFRRADYVARGPLDERFRFYRNLDIWWSLVLRDEGEGESPRRAMSIELPAVRHEHRGWANMAEEERNRQSKRNFYRIIHRFGSRRDLLIANRTRA